jgi:hypothetical protein
MTDQLISLYNAYIIVGAIATLLHIFSMVARKQNNGTILRMAVFTFAAWPALPWLYMKYRKYRKNLGKPLAQRDSVHAMLKATRNHFDERPFIVVAYDTEKEALHVYSSTSKVGRDALLKHAMAANDEQLSEQSE